MTYELERIVNPDDKPKTSLTDKLAEYYYTPKSFEKWQNGRIYEYMGIKPFRKKLLKLTTKLGRKRENEQRGSNYFIGGKIDQYSLKKFELKTRQNEKIHMGSSVPLLAIGGALVLTGMVGTAILPLLAGTFNVYLGCLQRYHRATIYNRFERLEKRNEPI